MQCHKCSGSGIIARSIRNDSTGKYERTEYDCDVCQGAGTVPDPNANERMAAALEHIATTLDAILLSIRTKEN